MEALRHRLHTISHAKDSLVANHTRLTAHKESVQYCTAPIRRVPPEIVAQVIFFATRWEDGTIGEEERQTFMNIRSVCKLWRETSFSTPPLWRDLYIEGSSLACDSQTISKRLSSWLRHCKNVDRLDISVNPNSTGSFFQVLLALSKGQFPITGLHLDNCNKFFNIIPLANLPEPMQAVKKLSLTIPSWRDDHKSTTLPFLSLTSSFPTLEYLALRSDQRAMFFTFGHSHIQVLEMESVRLPLPSLRLILENLPSLRELWAVRLSFTPPRGDETISTAPFLHHYLEKIAFGGPFPVELLSALTCPAIETLSLGATKTKGVSPDSEAQAARVITDFVHRSNPPSIFITLRRGIIRNFIQNLFTGFNAISSNLELRVPRFDLLLTDSGAPLAFPHSLRTVLVGKGLHGEEFSEWLVKLGLDGSDCPIEVKRDDSDEFGAQYY
ncbi:hypothetical protein BKA70DRAFT_1279118 [Coprinopsis sp. MPI-PUGE-AT-0042]|nr:hypothetical protein BKA70DRAFT_1279118 [Coprinopsis sp. MPI-PUGE-AT-0042]